MPQNSFFRSQLRLFLSVDIVGSTAFKQSQLEKEDDFPQWLSVLTMFYLEVEEQFMISWKKNHSIAKIEHKTDLGSPPQLWKTVGDEVLYTKEITSPIQLVWTMDAWIKAIANFRKNSLKRIPDIDIKLSAWTAGFPAINSEVIISPKVGELSKKQFHDQHNHIYANLRLLEEFHTNQKSQLVRDFIGPSIDTGFRLSSCATVRKFTISVELAFALSTIQDKITSTIMPNLKIAYDGKRYLKGVLQNKAYPIFWIDIIEHIPLDEDDKGIQAPNLDNKEIIKYTKEFINSCDAKLLVLPYIVQDSDNLLKTPINSKHEEIRSSILKYYVSDTVFRQEMEKSVEPKALQQIATKATSDNLKGFDPLNKSSSS